MILTSVLGSNYGLGLLGFVVYSRGMLGPHDSGHVLGAPRVNLRTVRLKVVNATVPICTYIYIYVCVYVCMYVCTYVRTYVRTYVCMYVCMYIYVCVYVYVYIYIDIHTR